MNTMIRTFTAALLVATFAGCAESPRLPLWNTFDLLALAENTAGQVTLFRCATNDNFTAWSEPEAIVSDALLAGGSCVARGPNGKVFVTSSAGVLHIADDGTVELAWSDNEMRDPAHVLFDAAHATAFITDRSARCVFAVDVTGDAWRTERVITSERFVAPIASRVQDDHTLEVLDRRADRLLRYDLRGTAPVVRDKMGFGDVRPVALVARDLFIDTCEEGTRISERCEAPQLIEYLYTGTYEETPAYELSEHREQIVPGVTAVACAELFGEHLALLGTNESGTVLLIDACADEPTRVDCSEIAKPIDIMVVN